ncbi:MAG: GNAT family N-acetyltransferase [Clostridium sp.]|nr:GNAT family N-acetyltransferase [Clostridium sp.]
MRLEIGDIVIRCFEHEDAENIYRIVREKSILRFMRDWSENGTTLDLVHEYIDYQKSVEDSTDLEVNRRYAIAFKDSDEMIGMVGVGLEDTVNEVEIAYFMSEKYQRRGYTQQAVKALIKWCFNVSDKKYLILTIDCANTASNKLAEKCGFELFEKRTPIKHVQHNMESDSYYYYRYYRS